MAYLHFYFILPEKVKISRAWKCVLFKIKLLDILPSYLKLNNQSYITMVTYWPDFCGLFSSFSPNFCLFLYVSDPMKISEVLTNSIFEAHSRTTLLRTEEIRQHWQKGVDQTKLFAFRNMVSFHSLKSTPAPPGTNRVSWFAKN